MTSEVHAAPVRFKDTSGQWQDIDLSLEKDLDGTVAPRGHEHDLELGKPTASSGGVFASAAAGAGREVEWLAPWKLPEPVLDGTKATYADVQPGVDLVLDARRSGFEHDFVVKQRPATAPVWRIPLRTKGLTAKPQADGSIQFVDAKNVVRSIIPVAYMWDAVTDPASGLPANTARVSVTVEQQSPGRAKLVISPDAAWFLDPARVFPVTVDPTYATGSAVPSFDTWVQSDVTTDQSASAELRVGSWNAGATKTRSFLNFSTAPFQGKQILGATLSLFESYSHTCTASTFLVKSANTASTATRWTSQPTTGGQYGSATAAKGFSSACPAGRVEVPITGLAQAWSEASYATGGLAVVAANENDSNGWKRFHSTEGAGDPFISITWNRAPATPAVPTFASAVAYAPPGGASVLYTPYLKPWTQTKATDADGNNVRYTFEFHDSTTVSASSLKASCGSTPGQASGTTDGCAPTVDLPENATIYIRAKATDGFLESGWSGWRIVRVGTQAPAAPSISCPAPYVINSWQDTAPTGNIVCTVTAPGSGFSAPGYVRVIVDGEPYSGMAGAAGGQIKITPSSDPNVAKTSVTIPKTVGGLHHISAQAETPAGKLSASVGYSFGWGSASMSQPSGNPRVTTTGPLRIEGSGPPRGSSAAPTVSLRWRLSGYGNDQETIGWNTASDAQLTVTDRGAAGISVLGSWDTTTAVADERLDSDPTTPQIDPTELNPRRPVQLDVQVCMQYASSLQCSWSETKATILRVPHAFDDGYPTAEAASGQVALWTGEFLTDVTDFEMPGYQGRLSLKRTHATFSGTEGGAFGPGWLAQFDGADVGAANLSVLDNTRLDGTIGLTDGHGSVWVWRSPSARRRTTAALEAGAWKSAEEDGFADEKLSVSGSGTTTKIVFTQPDGTETTFVAASDPASADPVQFRPTLVEFRDLVANTTFSYDGSGRISRILAPAPPGVTCSTTGALSPGCRALRFEYAATGAGERLAGAWLDIYNVDKPGGAGMDSIKVAGYSYDSGGRLGSVVDPRSNLSTEYGYTGSNQLASIKPPGQLPVHLEYVTTDNVSKLASVKRDRPAGDQAGGVSQLAKFVYNVPLSGPGLPDLSVGSVARWGQRSAPAKGFAVFGPDRPLVGEPGEDDWPFADLVYADADGNVVNTAQFGAGNWQHTATDYDDKGNVVRSLDERALRLVIDGQMPAGATVDQLATTIVYNVDIKDAADDAVLVAAGTVVTDTYGPARFATLRDGTTRWVRSHDHKDYDEGAPNGGVNPATSLPYLLLTRESTSVHDPGTTQDLELVSHRLTGYDPWMEGDPSGWPVGQPARKTIDTDLSGATSSADLVKLTRYDAEGRIIEIRQPASNGADAGTTRIVYYSAAANPSAPACGGKPQWAGLVCRSGPVAAPSAGPATPTIATEEFTYLLAPKTVVETSGAVTRSSTTTYLLDGRTRTTKTTVSGLGESSPNTEKETSYDPATGLATVVTAKAPDGTTSSVASGYDGWGRQTTYQPSGEQPAVTKYDAAGRIATVTDSNGSTTYAYDGIDADGKSERRGLATGLVVAAGGATWSTAGAYDADGSLAIQKLPGGITRITERDNAGEPVGLRYSGQVSTANDDGSTTVDPGGGWLSWSTDNDVTGRVAREWTPAAAAFTGPAGDTLGDATGYDRAYAYDGAGRLTRVQDRTADATGVDITDPLQAPSCITRSYSFDSNDNRLAKDTATSGPGAACTTTGPETTTREYDTADRPVTGAGGVGSYQYDALGRTAVLPASDAPRPSGGPVALKYYDNDLVHSITQAGTTTTFTLDAMDRRAVDTVATAAGSSQSVRHYTNPTDSPTWISNDAGFERYATMPGAGLSLILAADGSATIPVANPHGDLVSNIRVASPSPAVSIDGWQHFDEYGNQVSSAAAGGRFGWLGVNQRELSGAGLSLMGVRVYNPATGLFLSADPVFEGGANRYAYPTDPVNLVDLTGKWWAWYWWTARNWYAFEFYTRYFGHIYGIPLPRSNQYPNTLYGVYRIHFRNKGIYSIWKYGLTRKGDSRYKSQLSTCRRYSPDRVCTGKFLVTNIRGWQKARIWEVYFITLYAITIGGGYRKCPPGQPWPSCR